MLLAAIGALLLYVGISSALLLWPRATTPGSEATIEILVRTNGVHTDLVLPLLEGRHEWRMVFPPTDAIAPPVNPHWIAVGWGDRQFYLNTPQWSDLTWRTAWGALSGQGSTLLHVEFLGARPVGPSVRRWQLTPQQYDELAQYVIDTARRNAGRAVSIPGQHYNRYDAFYEAEGRYHLFRTCNGWTGAGLRRAQVPVSPWTPFDWQVFWHLPAA